MRPRKIKGIPQLPQLREQGRNGLHVRPRWILILRQREGRRQEGQLRERRVLRLNYGCQVIRRIKVT